MQFPKSIGFDKEKLSFMAFLNYLLDFYLDLFAYDYLVGFKKKFG